MRISYLFEIAKYNFTSYMVRNFDIQIENIDDIHRMVIMISKL